MITVKLSHSSISQWANGYHEDAIAAYLGKKLPKSPAMELGIIKHQLWENHAKKHGELHPELGGAKLKNPIIEQFYHIIIPFSDEYQICLIGKMDIIDPPELIDGKCGKSSPGKYLAGHQGGYYQLIAKGNGIDLKVFKLICFNPITGKHEIGIQYLTQKTQDRALNHVLTHGGEMIEYLESQKFIKDYDPEWREKPASKKQTDYVTSLGGEVPKGMTAGEASDVINKLKGDKQ